MAKIRLHNLKNNTYNSCFGVSFVLCSLCSIDRVTLYSFVFSSICVCFSSMLHCSFHVVNNATNITKKP